jgi:hypothetical protein
MRRQANGLKQLIQIIVISAFNSLVVAPCVCKVGNITYDEQTHMRTMDGKLNALAGSQSIDNIDGSLKLFERRS